MNAFEWSSIRRVLRFFGITAIGIGWLTILTSIMLNPWFSFYKNALSDLGALGVEYNFVFNYGLGVAAIFAIAYGFYLLTCLDGKLAAFASSFFILGSIHLLLIASFPEGTYPHLFVSLEFFILMGISILLYGIAFTAAKQRLLGVIFLGMALGGFSAAVLVPWPSIACLEVFAIALMSIWAILMLRQDLRMGGSSL